MTDKDHGPRLGADPELFVQTAEGTVVPVCGKVGGTKEVPLIINHLVDAHYGAEEGRGLRGNPHAALREGNYAVQEDNVMLEFNVPAYTSGGNFSASIEKILFVLDNNVLPQQGLRLNYGTTYTFKPEDIAPHPQAFTIGCLPDLNAYAEEGNFQREPFNITHFGNHRFCGGHLHVQYNYNNVPRHVFTQFMDLVVGLPFLRYDKQKMRRMFYGQPGIFREKPYGIEYRTPSNFWLGDSFRKRHLPEMVENIFSLARAANSDPEHLRKSYGKIDWADVQQAIRTENVKLADEIIEHARMKVGISMGPSAQR